MLDPLTIFDEWTENIFNPTDRTTEVSRYKKGRELL